MLDPTWQCAATDGIGAAASTTVDDGGMMAATINEKSCDQRTFCYDCDGEVVTREDNGATRDVHLCGMRQASTAAGRCCCAEAGGSE